MDPADVLTIVLLVTVPSALILAALRYRRLWRSARRQLDDVEGSEARPDTTRELMYAVDAIALEVERVSENQRFLTKVLAEREAASQPKPLAESTPQP